MAPSAAAVFDGAKLRAFREARGLSQAEFAAKLVRPGNGRVRGGAGKRARHATYTRQLIALIETGKARPSMKLLEVIAAAYGVDLRAFFSAA